MKKLKILWDVKILMRDGIALSADIYRPPEYTTEYSFPVLLMRTPYLKNSARHIEIAKYFAYNGYIFVFQDVRGRGDSDGDWKPFQHEEHDGYDSIEWIARQPWCNGKVGMLGGSYLAYVQWAAAREHPPHLVTFVSTAAGGAFHEELPYFNGIPHLGMIGWLNSVGGRSDQEVSTSLINWRDIFLYTPLLTLDETWGRLNTVWRDWISHPSLDDFWKPHRLTEIDFRTINLPVLHITGWFDGDQPGALFFYKGMVDHSPAQAHQYFLAGPWCHKGTWYPTAKLWGREFTNIAILNIMELHLSWFDHHLKGIATDFQNWVQTKYFVMGSNQWETTTESWPDHQNLRQIFLHSKGHANTKNGDGTLSSISPSDEPPDAYRYDPKNPVCMDPSLFQPIPPEEPLKNGEPKYKIQEIIYQSEPSEEEGSMDLSIGLGRPDILVYTGEILTKLLKIVGNPYVEIYGNSDCTDTDWFVNLSEVYPDGRSLFITRRIFGLLRARYRDSLENPMLLVPGQIYKFRIDLGALAIAIPPGNQLRILITSSFFPEFARNHNTGGNIAKDTEFKVATNRIYHDHNHPSSLFLPIRE